jgi:Zn-finger protein
MLLELEAAWHIKMARSQRALYRSKVARAVQDATAKKDHSEKVYTFVVDYGQNMELPSYSYNSEQPGCTYCFSPLTVFNLGVVNHAHAYNDGHVSEHMHAHLYHKGVGKKGVNNVASLIEKKLRQLNFLREDSVGGELNIIFDNCSGQNNNNRVLKLAVWLMAMNYFKEVNFIFLIVGHTKNAADRLFNSLKTEYSLQNLFTFQDLLEALNGCRWLPFIQQVWRTFLITTS